MRVFFLIVTVIGCCVSEYCPKTPCSKEDQRCLDVLFDGILYDVSRGIPKFDIPPLDPLIIDINDEFSTLSYKCGNSSVVGLNDIALTDVLVSADLAMMSFTLVCPYLEVTMDFDADGYMVHLPVGGKGKAENTWGLQKVIVYTKVNLVNGTDCKTYMQFGNFSIDVSLEGKYTVKFLEFYDDEATINKFLNETKQSTKDDEDSDGSDDPQKDSGIKHKDEDSPDCCCENDATRELINEYNKFAEKNGGKISLYTRKSIWYPIVTHILTNMNKFLARYPQDTIIKCYSYY